jgi:hypothetical protein
VLLLPCIVGHVHEGRHVVDSNGVHRHILHAVLNFPAGIEVNGDIDSFCTRFFLAWK